MGPPPTVDPDRIIGRLLYRFVSREPVVRLQRRYVRFFSETGARKVLDVGCGRGIFLELLRDAGIEACGVDGNTDAAAECRRLGFDDVTVADALDFLDRRLAEGARYDGIFCSHVIEHLPARAGIQLIAASAALLSPGGRLVIVTPNVSNLHVWTKVFWMDPTHERPYPRPLLEAIMDEAGLTVAASFDDRRTRGSGMLGRLLRFGPGTLVGQDAIVVGQRPRE